MCEHGDTVLLSVPIPAWLSWTGRTRWADVAIDQCLALVVERLNAAGRLTANCCCGHGRTPPSIILHSGRTLTGYWLCDAFLRHVTSYRQGDQAMPLDTLNAADKHMVERIEQAAADGYRDFGRGFVVLVQGSDLPIKRQIEYIPEEALTDFEGAVKTQDPALRMMLGGYDPASEFLCLAVTRGEKDNEGVGVTLRLGYTVVAAPKVV